MFSTDMDDMLNAIFNGGGFGGLGGVMSGNVGSSTRRQRSRRGCDVSHILPVSLEDVYTGKKTVIHRTRVVSCSECKGSGMKGKKPRQFCVCQLCRGSGSRIMVRQMGMMVQQIQTVCEACNGTGESISARDRCSMCNGEKTMQITNAIEVNVERGMSDEQKIILQRMSDESPNEDMPGDLIIVLQQAKHELFKRNGNDLHIRHNISLEEALCGFQLRFTHLDGRELFVRRSRGEITTPGSVFYVQGEGMPIYHQKNKFGNLIVEFDVEYPSILDRTKLKFIKQALPPFASKSDLTSLEDNSQAVGCNTHYGTSGNCKKFSNSEKRQFASARSRSDVDDDKNDNVCEEVNSVNECSISDDNIDNDSKNISISSDDEIDTDGNIEMHYIVKEDINALRREIAREQETDDTDDIPTVACAHQ